MAASDTRTALRLTQTFIDLYPAEAAQHLEAAPAADVARLLEAQTPARAARLLEQMSPAVAIECVQLMADGAAAVVLSAADVTRVAAMMAALDEAQRERCLSLVDPGLAREIKRLMIYPPGTAGHMMDPRVFGFAGDLTARQVLSRLHTLRRARLQTLFVVDAGGRLIGALPLYEVVLAPPDQRLADLARAAPTSVPDTAPREQIVEALADYRLNSLPVVDFEGRLMGIIRRDAMIQAAKEEATAGIQTMVGVGREERALSGPLFAVRKRLAWLNVNLLTAFLAAAVVGLFESTIARFTALAVLLPVVAGQSGNTGAQALAVTMRGLALREIRLRHWVRMLLKEAVAGAANGAAIALVTMAGVYIWSGNPGLCLVIGAAMVISMAIAGIAGTTIPMLMTALRQDPAQSSTIILTTVTDVVGFFSFLGLATLLARLIEE